MGHGVKYIIGHGIEVNHGKWERSESWDMGMK